jgi:hypothetical protein
MKNDHGYIAARLCPRFPKRAMWRPVRLRSAGPIGSVSLVAGTSEGDTRRGIANLALCKYIFCWSAARRTERAEQGSLFS